MSIVRVYVWSVSASNLLPPSPHSFNPPPPATLAHTYDIFFNNTTASTFTPSALWLDNVKDTDHWFDNWHFQDNAVGPDASKAPPLAAQNGVWAINTTYSMFSVPYANAWERAFGLRLLTHITGDLHQPLHTVSYYSPMFPHGDQGGNRWKVHDPLDSDITNLHSFFDNGAGILPAPPKNLDQLSVKDQRKLIQSMVSATSGKKTASPLAQIVLRTSRMAAEREALRNGVPPPPSFNDVFETPAGLRWIAQLADKFIKEQPPSDFPKRKTDLHPQVWVEESIKYAVEKIYVGIVPNGNITETYRTTAQTIVHERIALGGYRLGSVVNFLLSADTGPEPIWPSSPKSYKGLAVASLAINALLLIGVGVFMWNRHKKTDEYSHMTDDQPPVEPEEHDYHGFDGVQTNKRYGSPDLVQGGNSHPTGFATPDRLATPVNT
jgi:S1/P1 Nuclease